MISVIVPIYNVGEYLTACIRSITEQTYTDLQILLIDDGSTDQSGMICDAFAEKDSRIKVLHVENRGVSAARNTGIEMAEGEWTAFVDGDDIVHPELLARLLETAERTGADVCKCGYVNIHSKESEKTFLANQKKKQADLERTGRQADTCKTKDDRAFVHDFHACSRQNKKTFTEVSGNRNVNDKCYHTGI